MNEIPMPTLPENCEQCGQKLLTERGYRAIGFLCDECIAKLDDKPYPSPKLYLGRDIQVELPDKFNRAQLYHVIYQHEREMCDEIERKLKDVGGMTALVIHEHKREEKIDEIIENNGRFSLNVSYVFADYLMMKPHYEDRDKEYSIVKGF